MKSLTSYVNKHINTPILRRYLMACLGTLTLGATFLPNAAHAVCKTTNTGFPINPSYPSSISTSRDATIPGTQLPSSKIGAKVSGYFNGCVVDTLTSTPLGILVPGVTFRNGGLTYPVYETGIPGIGYVMDGGRDNFGSVSEQRAIGPGTTLLIPESGTSPIHRVYLVMTGPLVTGSFSTPTQRIASLQGTNRGVEVDFSPPMYALLGPLNITVTARACTVTSGANNAVTMPTLLAHSLKTVGAVSDASASFSIAVKCDADLGLYATVTDASDPTNTSNTLTLAGNSTASGVGIQMFRSGKTTPLLFGPDSSKKGNTNQWLVGNASASGSTFTIPMVAKYVKTLPVIKPGSVSARSTITFSYQ